MPYTPPLSACFQPAQYKDLRLFADRTEELADLVGQLDSFLAPDAPDGAHILVRGQRGVGKSMLVRKAVDVVKDKWGMLVAEADCQVIAPGPESVLRTLARALADEAILTATNAQLRAAANLLSRIANATSVKVREIRTWTEQLKLGVATTFKFVDKMQFEFGQTRLTGKSKEMEETFERKVDAAFLQETISSFLTDCARVGQKVLVFVDNLDQAGYPEHKEDVERVTDIVRFLAGLADTVVLMTLRTEFVSRDLQKLCPRNFEVPPMPPEGLREVAEARMRLAGASQKTALERVGLARIAECLSGWTGNAWGFLLWLDYFDYQRKVDIINADAARLREALMPFVRQQFTGVRDDLDMLGKAYDGSPQALRTPIELSERGVSAGLIERAQAYAALIPDWLVDMHGYYLPPHLHFLAHNKD
ncbi:MAG: ATP-binding protein [Polyangiaceae bacterium]